MVFFKSKLTILAFVIIIGSVAGAVLFFQKEKQIKVNTKKLSLNTEQKNSIQTNETAKDSDNDSLMDWEEKIYGTNPQNPDTDGDGYLDGKEIANGYNPLVKAPGDQLSNFPLSPDKSQNNSGNLADELTAALAQKIVDLNKNRSDNKNGLRVPKLREFIPDFLKNNISREEYDFLSDSEFDEKAIKISQDNSKKAVRQYLNNFNSIIERHFSFYNKVAKDIVKEAYQSGNFTEFDNLLLSYDKAIKEFYNLPVPSGWAEIHKEEIKLLISSKKVFEAMRRFENDPLKAKLAIRGYYLAAFQSWALREKINSKAAADKI